MSVHIAKSKPGRICGYMDGEHAKVRASDIPSSDDWSMRSTWKLLYQGNACFLGLLPVLILCAYQYQIVVDSIQKCIYKLRIGDHKKRMLEAMRR